MKASVQNKPPCLSNSLGYSKPIFSGVGTILRAKIPVISQRPILRAGSSKDSCLGPVCYFFFPAWRTRSYFFFMRVKKHTYSHTYTPASQQLGERCCRVKWVRGPPLASNHLGLNPRYSCYVALGKCLNLSILFYSCVEIGMW